MAKPKKPYRHKTIRNHALHPETLMMSYGYDPELSEGSVKCPLFQTSTFVFERAADGKAFFEVAYGLREQRRGEEPGLIYSRINNPDLEILEDRLGLWDGAEATLVFSSGMAAISTTLWTFLRPGAVLLHSQPLYGGTEFLVHNVLPQFGIRPEGFTAGHAGRRLKDAAAAARKAGPIGAILIETPANPTNALVDIAECAELAKSLAGAEGRPPPVIVDNTFLGPLWQQPLAQGADLVVYSLTKYVGGHSDVIAGACLGAETLIAAVRGMRTILGTMSDPHTGWLLMRSLETLKLRMTAAMKTARHVAEYLADHPKVKKVHYLGFLTEEEPDFAIYRRQCKAPGSTFAFEVHGGEAEAFRLLDALQLIPLAVSLGGTESLAEHPGSMTHSDIPPDRQAELGITPAMLRLSVGVEHPEDLIADLAQALEAV
jgi:methionine-gamma-lyase